MEDYTFTILLVLENLEIDSQALFNRAVEYSSQHYSEADYYSDDLDKSINEYRNRLGPDGKIVLTIGIIGLSIFIVCGVMYLITKFDL